MDALLMICIASKLRSLLGTSRYLLLEGLAQSASAVGLVSKTKPPQRPPATVDLTTMAVGAQKVLDALESRLNADESTG